MSVSKIQKKAEIDVYCSLKIPVLGDVQLYFNLTHHPCHTQTTVIT